MKDTRELRSEAGPGAARLCLKREGWPAWHVSEARSDLSARGSRGQPGPHHHHGLNLSIVLLRFRVMFAGLSARSLAVCLGWTGGVASCLLGWMGAPSHRGCTERGQRRGDSGEGTADSFRLSPSSPRPRCPSEAALPVTSRPLSSPRRPDTPASSPHLSSWMFTKVLLLLPGSGAEAGWEAG